MMERSNVSVFKKSSYNFIFGIFGEVIVIVVGILLPRLFVMNFGSEVNGFISSINQIFVYISLLEAGVGTASLQALYSPVGKGDNDKINRILAATGYYYKRIGIIYSLIIVIIAFVYPLITSSSLDYFLMVGIVLLVGLGGSFVYLFQGKYKILLQAEGKNYVISNFATINSILLSLAKAVLLLLGFNVIIVESSYLILNFLQSFAYILYIKAKYKWINLKAEPDFKAISQKNSVIIHQISGLIFNNTDILVLTFFCDFKVVSVYTIYKYLVKLISSIISYSAGSVSFRLGQIFDDKDKFIRLYDVYEIFNVTLSFALCAVAYGFITPFLQLYTAGMDYNYIYPYLPLCFLLVELLNHARTPNINVVTYAGHFKQTQWRSFAESVLNLTTSIVLVNFLGIYGVLLGTIVALLYRDNDLIIYTNHKILNRSAWKTYRLWFTNIICAVLTYLLFTVLPLPFKFENTYFNIILSAVIMCVIVFPSQFAINYLINYQSGKELISVIKGIFKKKEKIKNK